jgi:hypothetical protein
VPRTFLMSTLTTLRSFPTVRLTLTPHVKEFVLGSFGKIFGTPKLISMTVGEGKTLDHSSPIRTTRDSFARGLRKCIVNNSPQFPAMLLLLGSPHCLKKKGTLDLSHCS